VKWNIELLSANHDHSGFACGQEYLDKFLKNSALRNQVKGYGRTYVASGPDTRLVSGYYTVSMSSVQFANLPESLQYSTMPRYPMPAAHLGALAVRSELQRKGLGSILLIDAMRRMIAASEIVAARAIEVKAANDAVCKWYEGYGFAPFNCIGKDPYHLFLPIDTAKQIIASAGA
jgi:ribosomal protein S18 acetylase RimI-like enzyme